MTLRGVFNPSGDKSISHRIALISLLAEGQCRVENYSTARDAATTLKAVRLLGGEVEETGGGSCTLRGAAGKIVSSARADCENSGTTLRLLMGILAGRPGQFVLDGDDSLRRRPMERVAEPLRRMGAGVECTEGTPPVTVRGGPLRGLRHALPVPSAQLKSALLLAGLQAQGETTVLEPLPSRDHTERLLSLCGAGIRAIPGGWRVERSPLTLPPSYRVPGDVSSAAFFLCAAAILPGSDVAAHSVLLNPTRTGFLEGVLTRMGAHMGVEAQGEVPEPWGRIRARFSPDLAACEVHAHEIPGLVDEVPILALVATQARGTTVFHRVQELRVKEADRLSAIATQLGAMGARLGAVGDDLVVEGPTPLRPAGALRSFGDHRIAMTLRLAGLLADSEPAIEEEACVAVSYPGFHEALKGLLR